MFLALGSMKVGAPDVSKALTRSHRSNLTRNINEQCISATNAVHVHAVTVNRDESVPQTLPVSPRLAPTFCVPFVDDKTFKWPN